MMKNRHILLLQWLLCSMLTVLFSACSSSDAAEGPKEATHQQPQLAIYVYAPEQAAAKRNAAWMPSPTKAPLTACRYGYTNKRQEIPWAISALRMYQH